MRKLLIRIGRSLTAAGQPPRTRALRLGAEGCLVAAVVLLSTALVLALNQQPTKSALKEGVVYNVPLTATASPLASATPSSDARTATALPPTESPTPQPTEVPTPEPTPEPSGAPVIRLMIPAIKVNAPISFKGVDAHGVMEDPNSWNDVAYYTFTGKPGFGTGNNAVFAGHVDYIRHGTAVFWDLDKLKPGDQINVTLQDGTDYSYRVTQMVVYNADDAPVDAILGDTPNESVTLITCNGTFSAGEYNNRLVVRAERVDAAQPQS